MNLITIEIEFTFPGFKTKDNYRECVINVTPKEEFPLRKNRWIYRYASKKVPDTLKKESSLHYS